MLKYENLKSYKIIPLFKYSEANLAKGEAKLHFSSLVFSELSCKNTK